jgi:hypothetical protein
MHPEYESHLWQIADALRSNMDAVEYKSDPGNGCSSFRLSSLGGEMGCFLAPAESGIADLLPIALCGSGVPLPGQDGPSIGRPSKHLSQFKIQQVKLSQSPGGILKLLAMSRRVDHAA